MALITLVSSLTNILRDVADAVATLTNLAMPLIGGIPGIGQVTNIIRGISTVLDWVAPIVDFAGKIAGAFFNPLGALESKLGDFWEPLIEQAFRGATDGGLALWLFKVIGKENLGWIYNSVANGIALAIAPDQFCSWTSGLDLCG